MIEAWLAIVTFYAERKLSYPNKLKWIDYQLKFQPLPSFPPPLKLRRTKKTMTGNEWRTLDMTEKSLSIGKPQDANFSGVMINNDSNPTEASGIDSLAFA